MKSKEAGEQLIRRENNYDLLRIIATLAVIMIHVSASYKDALANPDILGACYTEHVETIYLYNVFSRFAVPCFVMLSGAFVLADERNREYRYFYRKIFKNVGIPTLIFSVGYFLFSVAIKAAAIVMNGGAWAQLLEPVILLLKGEPYYHMWYLYMMIGVYILVPVIIRFKESVDEKTFSVVAWVFLVVASISVWTGERTVNWDLGDSFCYLGYFMVGYEIRKSRGQRKGNLLGTVMILLGGSFEFLIALIQIKCHGTSESTGMIKNLIDPQCPLVVLASVLIFVGFSCLDLKRGFGFLPKMTFLIYLFHAGVWEVLKRLIVKMWVANGDCRIIIPVAIVTCFIISNLLAILYSRIWSRVNKNERVSNFLCKWI